MDTLPPHADNGKPSPIPSTSGIYKITCTATGKIYVGSAMNLSNRKSCHFKDLRQNKHHNRKLQNAWNKYGEDAFIFEVVELVLTPELLTAREQFWLNSLKPFNKKGFNIAREAGSSLGVKRTPETREKVRQANLGKKLTPEAIEKTRQANLGRKNPHAPEAIEKNRQAHLGKKQSPETIEKRIAPLRGRKRSPESIEKTRQAHLGKKRSPETIEKMRQANLGKKQSPETIERKRQASLGRKRSPESIERTRQFHLGRKRSPETCEHIRLGLARAKERSYATRGKHHG